MEIEETQDDVPWTKLFSKETQAYFDGSKDINFREREREFFESLEDDVVPK